MAIFYSLVRRTTDRTVSAFAHQSRKNVLASSNLSMRRRFPSRLIHSCAQTSSIIRHALTRPAIKTLCPRYPLLCPRYPPPMSPFPLPLCPRYPCPRYPALMSHSIRKVEISSNQTNLSGVADSKIERVRVMSIVLGALISSCGAGRGDGNGVQQRPTQARRNLSNRF